MQWIRTLAVTLLPFLPCVGQVQSAELATATPAGDFAETFDLVPASSGIPMVGLRLVSSDSEFGTSRIDLSEVVVSLPAEGVPGICVRVTTQDARYLALNPYKIDGATTDLSRARLKPVSEGYEEELENYTQTEVAIKTYVANDGPCNPVLAQHLPRIGMSNLDSAEVQALEIRVNSRGRDVRATLTPHPSADTAAEESVEALRLEVDCGATQNRAGLAFDRLCRIPFDDYAALAGMNWTLTLALNDGFADSLHGYTVYLP